MLNDGVIEIVPLSFLQGRTFINAVIIVDETQNLDNVEIEMLFTRIGKGSKMVMCGDLRQRIIGGKSGLASLTYIAERSARVSHITLTTNFRDPIVEELLELYDTFIWNYDNKTNKSGTEAGSGKVPD